MQVAITVAHPEAAPPYVTVPAMSTGEWIGLGILIAFGCLLIGTMMREASRQTREERKKWGP
jgi:putative Mn2+ efflux pump MntP